MCVFVEVKDIKYLKDVDASFLVAVRGCQRASIRGECLSHWVLTTAKGVDLDLFDSFGKLVERLFKKGVVFEFFAVEAKNKLEGRHLHVLVSTDVVGVDILRNHWAYVHDSDMVYISQISKSENEPLVDAIARVSKYVTFGNHRRSMVRYGFSSNWIGSG